MVRELYSKDNTQLRKYIVTREYSQRTIWQKAYMVKGLNG